MKRSTIPAVAVFLIVVVVAGLIVAALAIGTNGASAVEVGDQRISRESVNGELRAVANNDDLTKAAGADTVSGSPGTVRADAGTALVLTGVTQEAIIHEFLDQKGERVTDADRKEAKSLRPETTVGQFYSGFPKWYRDRYDERLASYVAVARVLGVDITAQEANRVITPALRRTAARSGVTVDPRYGRFATSVVQVVPINVTAADIASSNQSG